MDRKVIKLKRENRRLRLINRELKIELAKTKHGLVETRKYIKSLK